MWQDPILRNHEVAPRQYEISGTITPISVRDQILRGQMIVDRLLANEILAPSNSKLLIVGGGVAGIAAALFAVERQVEVTLLEKEDLLFSRIRACTTRRIDPTLYDWPADHWDHHYWANSTALTMPSNSPPDWLTNWDLVVQNAQRLVMRAGSPKSIVEDWDRIIARIQHVNTSRLKILPNTSLSKPPTSHLSGRVYAAWESAHEDEPVPFDAVLLAGGMGREQTHLKNAPPPDGFSCPDFWTDDDYANAYSQETSKRNQGQPSILIAGGGDGALQDYIRVVTGHHPAEVITKIESQVYDMIEWHKALRVIHSAQEDAHRQHQTLAQSIPPKNDTAGQYYRRWDAEIFRILDERFRNQVRAFHPLVREKINDVLKDLTHNRLPGKVKLVVRGSSFSWCFALNRFLGHILDDYLKTNYEVLFPHGTNSNSIDDSGTVLFGHSLVRITPEGDRYRTVLKADDGTSSRIYFANHILIRAGILRPQPLYGPSQGPLERQVLPFPNTA